jgi:ABC-type transport system substrate-binding protein
MWSISILEPLLAVHFTGQFVPMLATEWKLAPDRSYLDLTLRKGVKFHDGTDFNAEACKWNLDRWIAERGGRNPQMKSAEILDPYKVRLHLNYYTNYLFATLGSQGGFQVSPTAYQKNGREWARWNPVGTGPFKFVKYERDVKLTAVRFNDYWQKGKPYLDGMEYVVLSDPMTSQMAFRAGKLHVTSFVGGKQAADLKAAGFKYTAEPPEVRAVHLMLASSNNPKSPLADKRVRQAISYAINRKVYCDALGYGWIAPTNQIAPSGSPAYLPELKDLYPYNPEKAKELLKEAGYPNGFKTKLIVAPRWADPRDMKVAIQADLAKIGINVELEFPEEGKMQEYRFGKSGWGEGLIFHEWANWPLITGQISFYWNHNPDQFFDLKWPDGLWEQAQKALKTTNVEKAEMQKFTRMIFDDVTVIPVYELTKVIFSGNGVHDTNILNFGFFADWTPADAWLEPSARTKD